MKSPDVQIHAKVWKGFHYSIDFNEDSDWKMSH